MGQELFRIIFKKADFDFMNTWLNNTLSWHHLKLNKLSLQDKYIQEGFLGPKHPAGYGNDAGLQFFKSKGF